MSSVDRLNALSPHKRALIEALTQRKSAGQLAGTQDIPALVRQERGERIPLSFSQERLWLLEKIGGLGSAYHIANAVHLHGEIDIDALNGALTEIVRRHEILRTTIETHGEHGVQVIRAATPIRLAPVELAESELSARLERNKNEVFDLAKGPLYRFELIRYSPQDHVLSVVIHHIATDGWSVSVLLRELSALYGALKAGLPSPLGELPVQYADYAIWQRRSFDGAALQGGIDYWCRNLAGTPALLTLPWDRPRPAVQSHRGDTVTVSLPATLRDSLKALANDTGTTLYMVLLAAFNVVLGRWSGQQDVVVGTAIAGRTEASLEPLIGFFTNTLALRTDLSGDPTFRVLLSRVREQTLNAYTHQHVPFERIVGVLQPVPDLSRQPIFQAMFLLQNVPRPTGGLSGLKLKQIPRTHTTTKLDLSLYLTESPTGLHGYVEYATDLFDKATIERLCSHLRAVLGSIVSDPAQRLSEIRLLSDHEIDVQLHAWAQGDALPAALPPVHESFADRARLHPDAVALTDGAARLTYGELDRRANQLAHHLRTLGVGHETIVGLSLTRSFDLVVGLIAILKAGAAYLALDPGYPLARLEWMVEDARPSVIVTRSELTARLPSGASIVALDADAARIAAQPETAPAVTTDANDLAYVLYTSGSTGRPKGVLGTHGSVAARMVAACPGDDDAGEPRVYAQKTTPNFIDLLWEVFMPLTHGHSVAILDQQTTRDPLDMIRAMHEAQVTHITLVPSLLRALIESERDLASALPRLRYWVSTGERLPDDLASLFYGAAPHARLVNIYGTSEFWDATAYDVPANMQGGFGNGMPIGSPIGGMRVYVLDEAMNLVPAGTPGELYVGGRGVARGYLRQPALTAQQFVPDPFVAGARLYRTGDRARWLRSGVLEFVGRADYQVKVRGFRIELGEIENALLAWPSIAQAVVVARAADDGDVRLGAFVVAQRDEGGTAAAVEVDALRAALSARLPDHMMPDAIVVLEALPLTPNGKCDRRALPDWQAKRSADCAAPASETEAKIAAVFASLLKRERVGIEDNFFELGGHSLLAMRTIARLRDEFNVELGVRSLFENPSAARLAGVIEGLLQAQTGAGDAQLIEEMEQLSEQELSAMLSGLSPGRS